MAAPRELRKYLGRGIYADYDAPDILTLSIPKGMTTNWIALDSKAIKTLLRFIKKCQKIKPGAA